MPGIGSFGRFMIPFTAGATTGLGTYNAFQQQALKNQLDQQQMALNQGRLGLEAQNQRMQDAELRFRMGQELYNQKMQQSSQQGAAGMFAKMGALTSDPKERMFWDTMGNAAMNNVPPEQIDKMANTMGYGDQSKALREFYQAQWYQQRAGTEGAYGDLLRKMTGDPSAGASSTPSSPSMPSGYGMPPSAPAGPSAGGALGSLGSPVGTTTRYRSTIIPKGGQYFYVDGSGNVYGPIPMAGASVAGASAGGTP